MSERPTKCRHFNGIQHKICEVGIAYHDVAKPDSHPIDLPCFSEQRCTERCAKVSYYTPEELAEQDAEAHKTIKEYLDNLAADICPFCKAKVEEHEQVGRCTYAKPCGHRLYQGKATKVKTKPIHPYFLEQMESEQ